MHIESRYTKEYFEEGTISNYHGYKDLPHFGLLAKEIFSVFRPKRVLDVGCAKGYLAHHLRELGVEAYGIDISPYAIGEAPADIRPFVQVADIRKIPFADRFFDLVFSVDVLEHILEQDLETAIRELLRVGSTQVHLITTQERVTGKDVTHVTLKPLPWWYEKFRKKLGTIRKEENMIFLLASETHWMYDFLQYYYSSREHETMAKQLQKELDRIHSSRWWKVLSTGKRVMESMPVIGTVVKKFL